VNDKGPGTITPFSLTYSAPSYGDDALQPAPMEFYNAFPELNDVSVEDGSSSAFPRRAKYNFALDSIFIPSGKLVRGNTINERFLNILPEENRELVLARIKNAPNTMMMEPREPGLDRTFSFHCNFEAAHKLLARTEYKNAIRILKLGPFYTELEKTLSAGEQISVPLIAVKTNQGTELQRRWAAVLEAFQPSVILDEVLSLLIGLCLTETDDLATQENRWLAEHEAEIKGFTKFYSGIRKLIKIESIFTDAEGLRVAENILQQGRKLLNEFTLQGWDQVFSRWPESIPEFMQDFIASASNRNEDNNSFIHGDRCWDDFVTFHLCTQDSVTYLRAEPAQAMVVGSVTWPSDIPLIGKTDWFTAVHCIFVESLRQQICTGVGLRCPFWNGECCQSQGYPQKFKEILEKMYKITVPFYWPQHWQAPPCL
jgi:hypothetical protein